MGTAACSDPAHRRLLFHDLLSLGSSRLCAMTEVLAAWPTAQRNRVLECWEMSEPPVAASILADAISAQTHMPPPHLWQCDLCALKRQAKSEFNMALQVNATPAEQQQTARALPQHVDVAFFHSSEGMLRLVPPPPPQQQQQQQQPGDGDSDGGDGATAPPAAALLLYNERPIDLRHLCNACVLQASAFVTALGHDIPIHHAVDDERRALLAARRRIDRLKARWLRHEREQRAVGALMRSVCEATQGVAAAAALRQRRAASDAAAHAKQRVLSAARDARRRAVAAAARADPALTAVLARDSQRRVWQGSAMAALSLERSLGRASGRPASASRRALTSAQPADFAADALQPLTPLGAALAVGAPGARGELDAELRVEAAALRASHARAHEVGALLRVRELARERQRAAAARCAATEASAAWARAAREMAESRDAAAALRALTLEQRRADLAAHKAARALLREGLRAEAQRRRQVAEAQDERRRAAAAAAAARAAQEAAHMAAAEAAQRCKGDAYWGLLLEEQRLRRLIDEGQQAWEVRIRTMRERAVEVGVTGGGGLAWKPTVGGADPPLELSNKLIAALQSVLSK
ncbi:hypothetical protein JKP88DRAFT_333951 [Tribonema minus]|uniref:Uncharacterized protein n=1 Tax=Tribonema minus TaxID=303371 RepID=A0A835YM05_9STRA|nr:hypothetical protein JKP88DRAFT_333951 [Tribonema minus]